MPTAAPISQPPCAPSSSFSSRLSTTSRRRRRRPSWPHHGSPLPLLLLLPLLLFLLPPSPNVTAFPVTARLQQKPQRRISTSLFSSSSPSSPPPPSLPPSPSLVASAPTICFPGGGIYFYWQAGAVHYLQQHFNLRQANLVGASAGALTAALTGCDVSMPLAAERALSLSMCISLWERPLGLAGVWGGLVRQWLDELLPEDAAEQCRERVQLYVNLVERKAIMQENSKCLPLRRTRVSDFESRHDLLETCLASVHIPFFMDGKPLKRLGNRGLVLDGSFRLSKQELSEGGREGGGGVVLMMDHRKDPAFQMEGGPTDFVTLTSPSRIKGMMRAGYSYTKRLHESGELLGLESIALDRHHHRRPASPSSLPSSLPASPSPSSSSSSTESSLLM